MNYIYDIILNFNEKYIDFYDWNISDDIIEVRKIPIICVDSKTYSDLLNSNFKLENTFYNKVINKCEVYAGKSIKRITAFLITDKSNITAFKINKKIYYSSLQIDDELDILDDITLEQSNIKYKIIKKNKYELKTRNQIKNELFIKDTLSKMFVENNYEKLKYIYYECFNKKENKIEIIIKELNNIESNSKIMTKLYNVLSSINS